MAANWRGLRKSGVSRYNSDQGVLIYSGYLANINKILNDSLRLKRNLTRQPNRTLKKKEKIN